MVQRTRVSIQLHRHGRPMLPITSTVTSLQWTKSIAAPWQSLTVTWKATVKDSFGLVSVGDWVLLTSPGPAGRDLGLSLCHIDDVDSAVVNTNGTLQTTPITIKATSWWNLLQTVSLYSPKGWAEDIGTLLSMQTWSRAVGGLVSDYTVGALGTSLRKLFKLLAAVELPETLGGLKLSDVIPIVCDKVTKEQFAPTRVVESVDIGGGLPNRLTSMMQSYEANVGEIITGAFVPEPLLIEMFPSFEPFELSTSLAQSHAQAEVQSVTPSPNYSSPDTEMTSVDGTPPPPARQLNAALEVNPALANILGGWETLIYRIKPFRDRPLRESAVAHVNYQHANVEKEIEAALSNSPLSNSEIDRRVANEANRGSSFEASTQLVLDNIFEEDTWGYTTAKFFDKDEVRSLSFQRSDKTRLNASSIVLAPDPSTGIEALKQIGLPITYDEEIRRHGLRVLKPSWSFTLPTAETRGSSNLAPLPHRDSNAGSRYLAYLRTICAQFMQFYKNNHIFSKGALVVNLTEATTLKTIDSQKTLGKVMNLKPGETIVVRLKDNQELFYAYAESISHMFNIADGGVTSASTSISYSRGHFGVLKEALTDIQVPIRQGSAPSQQRGTPTGQVTNTPRTPYADTSPTPKTCAAGVAYRGWPTNLDALDVSKVPPGLVSWATARGFRRIPAGSLDTYRHELIAMACGYVIERYWAQSDPEAHIVFSTSPHGGAHNYGAAFDFMIRCRPIVSTTPDIPVFQNWAALGKLASNGRIPFGGRGLYVNISPSGVRLGRIADQNNPAADPTNPNNAGSASPASAAGRRPPGSSGGTHYDFRGTFGLTNLGGDATFNAAGTSWIWVDTTGDGRDDYKLGESGPGGGTEVYNQVHPKIKAYFLSKGLSDTSLLSVGTSVPNIMQVLGQVDSCFAAEVGE